MAAERWSRAEIVILAALVLAGFALRAWDLGAEGFADDEIHKWLAASRYLHGSFGGDDVEHPMLMKGLIAVAAALLPRSVAPEVLTRIPNVIAGSVTIWAVALLGRRLYGNAAGLIAAGLCALSAACVGYSRVAKEETLFALFLTLAMWCLAEARSAADLGDARRQRRFELGSAVSVGAMLAAKYYVFLLPLLPLEYLLLRRGSAWRVPLRRWIRLGLVAVAVMVALDWAALFPSTWHYMAHYVAGDKIGDRMSSESYEFMGRIWGNLGAHIAGAPPLYFYLVFAAVKFAPPTALLMAAGVAVALWRRTVADVLALSWLGFMLLAFFIVAVKYGRYFFTMMPPLVVLAGAAAAAIASRIRRPQARIVAVAAVGALALANEAWATIAHEPHPRLYVSAVGGGDARVDYFFPHCDYYDAGVRTAVLAIAAQAEVGAEIASETPWVVRYYADASGRADLVETAIRPSSGCNLGKVCYVIEQSGRRYWHNERALDRLRTMQAWRTVEVGGHTEVRVYRLAAGARLFAGAGSPSRAGGSP